MKVLLDRGTVASHWESQTFTNGASVQQGFHLTVGLTKDMAAWLQGLFTKVCLQVKTEDEILDIVAKAKAAGLPCALIEDSGLTEFGGVKTVTCCAIGPAAAADIDLITGQLPLL
jgi:PTH2 family peptidyl-tRNA hydrolase